MGKNPIALAVPFFFVLIGVEIVAARLLRRSVYRTTDAYGDIACGILQQVLGMFYGASFLVIYAWIYEHARLATIEPQWLAWTVAIVGIDFCYYWWHRASHRVNALWAGHVVHHQSE